MPRSIADIRRANGGLGNLTDEEILQATYQEYAPYYKSLDDYASAVGYGGAGRGLGSSRVSSGIDQYQANLYGLGGAVSRALGADGAGQWFDRQREANEQAAGYANQRAQDLGAVDDWRDVSGVGSGLNYLGGLAAQSLPYLGEAAVGALTGGVGLAGTAGRLGLSRAAAATLGATAASYPSAVGDVLSNQREAGGENLGMAALGGVPYAALNALGVEGLVARGLRPLAFGEGRLARMATGGASTALGEGLGETGQELVNQSFGRMAVNPNETLFNEEANRRYLDSFVGGAALGGAFGAAGGFRRPGTLGPNDPGNLPPGLEQDTRPSGPPPQLGYSPLAGTPIVFPDGSVALNGEQELMARYAAQPKDAPAPYTGPTLGLGYSPLAGTPLVFPDGSVALNGEQELMARYAAQATPTQTVDTPQFNLVTRLDPLQQRIDENLGIGQRGAPRNYPSQFGAAFNEPTGRVTVDPNTWLEKPLTAGELQLQALGLLPNEAAAPAAQAPKVDKLASVVAPEIAEAASRAGLSLMSSRGEPLTKRIDLFIKAVELANVGAMDADTLSQTVERLSKNKYGEVGRELVALDKDFTAKRTANVSTPSAPAGQPAGPSAGRSPDAAGSVVNPGPVPPVNEPVRGDAGGAQPAGQPAPAVADAAVQRAPVVATQPDPFQVSDESGQPVVQRRKKVVVTPAKPAAAYVAPDTVADTTPETAEGDGYVDDEDAWDDFRPDNSPAYKDLTPSLREAWGELRRRGKMSQATASQIAEEQGVDDTSESVEDVIRQIFGVDDANVMVDAFVNKQTAAQIAEKRGLDRTTVARKVGNGKVGQKWRADRIAAAQRKYGWTDEYVSSLMGDLSNNASEAGELINDEDLGASGGSASPGIEDDNSQQRDIAAFGVSGDLTLGDVGMSTVSSAGGSTGYKDVIGNRIQALTKQEIDELAGLREKRNDLEAQVAKLTEAGNLEALEAVQENLEKTNLRIAKLETGKAAPSEIAAALAQNAFDASERARAMMERIREAKDNGLDTITENQGKRSLAEAVADVKQARKLVRAALAAAEQVLRGRNVELLPATQEVTSTPETSTALVPVQGAKAAKAPKVPKPENKASAGQKLWDKLRSQVPALVPHEQLSENEQGYLQELAARTGGKPVVAKELGLQELMKRTAPQQITNEPITIDVEARVVEETLRPQLQALTDGRLSRLEKFYGVARDSAEFLAKVKEDVVTFATKGAEAVNAAIRDVIKALHAGVLSAAMIFNPTGITSPEAYAFIPPVETVTITREVRAELPAEVQGMSEAGKQAYATLVPALKGKNGDKLLVMADKPSGRMFVFDADGKLVVQKKTLFGLAKGDFYKGNNDLPQNRITPAGLFGLQLVDAAKGGSAKVTAGDYDFGKVFALQDPDAVVTIMHSVWLKEKDAGKRAAALKNDNPADSRYSFGCINVDKDTYKFLLDNYQAQMDGAKLFVVPDNQEAVKDFVAGTVPSDRLVREGVQPVTETVTTTRDNATQSPGRTPVAPGREQDTSLARQRIIRASRRVLESTDADGTDFEAVEASLDDLKGYYPGVEQGVDYLRDSGLGNAVDAIDSWMVTFSPVGWDAIYSMVNGRRTVIFNGVAIADQVTAITATIHEVGHAVDTIHDSTTTFSGSPEFNLRRRNGEVVAMKPGSVVSELIDHYFGEDSALSQLLAYPLNSGNKVNAAMGVDELREELFAQAWAFSNMPGGMDFLRDNLPATAAFMETVHEQVKATNYARPQNAQQNAQPGQVPDRTQAAGNVVRASRQAAAPTQGLIEKNVSKLPKQAQPYARTTANSLNRLVRKGLDYVVFTSDLAKRATEAGIKSASKFQSLLVERGTRARTYEREIERIADMYANVPEVDRSGERSALQFMFESTRRGLWGYDNGTFKADKTMAAWFNSLQPESQKFVREVFDHGSRMLERKKKTVLDFTASEYDANIKGLRDLIASGITGDELTEAKAELDEAIKSKKSDLDKFSRLFSMRDGKPYAPIKRFGPHAVVAKSQAYLDAVQANDRKKVRELEQNGDDYHVTFTETANEAESLANRLLDAGDFAQVQHFERSVSEDGLFGNDSMLNALTKLRSRISASDRAGTAQLREMVTQMYLQELAEASARKSEMRRRGVAGEVDMLRSFTTQGRADAHFLAATEFGSPLQDALQAMHKESRNATNRTRSSEVLNEVVRRYQQTFEYAPTPWLDKLRRMSSIYFLATSPSYYMQNLTQPWMMSVPAMAGAHDYTQASAELFKAYGQMKDVVKSGGLLNQMFDFQKVPGDVRSAIQELVNRGKIDIGMDTELGEFRAEGQGAVRDTINKADKALRLAVQKVETINRLSTAMAAIRLEKAKGRTDAQAIEYADRILTETHGDYTAFNSPRIFNTQFGKIALQFRKFQLIQLSYYAKLINDIVNSPAERRAAAKMLAFSLGHTALLAGVRGLPGFATIAWLAGKLFGDDDEPFDLEQSMRNAIGDKDYANLVMRGAPTLLGADISGKVGAGNMLSITPFSDADLSTPAGMAQWVGTLIGGASLGMTTRMVDGLGQMLSGDALRGLELLMPKGVGDAIKAYRIGSDGVTRRNGDVLMSADEVSVWESAMQAMGIQPVDQAVVSQQQRLVKDTDQALQDRAGKIKNDYVKAARSNDSAAKEEARQAWTKLQEARVRQGYTRQPMSELIRAPMEAAKRQRDTIDGVQANKQNRRFVEQMI